MSEDVFGEQRRAAGIALTQARRQLGLATKVKLAERAGVHPRTLRRIELGETADLASYAAVGYVLGWPPDWFLRADDLLERATPMRWRRTTPSAASNTPPRLAEFGLGGIALIRDIHDFAREHPGAEGDLEILSRAWRADLRRRAAGTHRREHERLSASAAWVADESGVADRCFSNSPVSSPAPSRDAANRRTASTFAVIVDVAIARAAST